MIIISPGQWVRLLHARNLIKTGAEGVHALRTGRLRVNGKPVIFGKPYDVPDDAVVEIVDG